MLTAQILIGGVIGIIICLIVAGYSTYLIKKGIREMQEEKREKAFVKTLFSIHMENKATPIAANVNEEWHPDGAI